MATHSHRLMTSVGLYVQEACHSHRYIRSRDDSSIVERPERLRSVAVGIAAAISRLEEVDREASEQRTGLYENKDVKSLHEQASAPPRATDLSGTFSDVKLDPSGQGSSEIGSSSQRVELETEIHDFPNSLVAGSETRTETDQLASALEGLTIEGDINIAKRPQEHRLGDRLNIIRSDARASLLDDAAVKYIHGDIEG